MFYFGDLDLSTLPELPHRHRWSMFGGDLQICAVRTKWYDCAEEGIYLLARNGDCKYWKLFSGHNNGHWEFGGSVDAIDTGIKLLTAWCHIGIADYTLLPE